MILHGTDVLTTPSISSPVDWSLPRLLISSADHRHRASRSHHPAAAAAPADPTPIAAHLARARPPVSEEAGSDALHDLHDDANDDDDDASDDIEEEPTLDSISAQYSRGLW